MKKRGLKFSVQNKIIHRTIKNNKRTIVFPSINSIKNIGIVGNDDNINGFDFSSNQLTKGVKLNFLTTKIGKRDKAKEDVNIYSSDLNFWGLPQKRIINSFISEPFDVLINIADETERALAYICAASVSKFKISINTNK